MFLPEAQSRSCYGIEDSILKWYFLPASAHTVFQQVILNYVVWHTSMTTGVITGVFACVIAGVTPICPLIQPRLLASYTRWRNQTSQVEDTRKNANLWEVSTYQLLARPAMLALRGKVNAFYLALVHDAYVNRVFHLCCQGFNIFACGYG